MFSLYIHFPFCLKKCNYCDFLSGPITSPGLVQDYLQALTKELTIYHSLLSQKGIPELETIYLGGGTPTLLQANQLVQVLQKCRDFFHWSPGIEITVEANPGTVDRNKLEQLQKAGVNRLSFGVQSFNPAHLEAMGRIHSPEEAKESIVLARKAGFNNISLDLIFGLPNQTLADWEDTLAQAIALDLEHISAYGLKVEEGTPWGFLAKQDQLALPDEDTTLLMRHRANQLLGRAGFKRYEISNYAKEGLASKHNLGYWIGRSYLGLGLGASSYFWQRRFSNTTKLNHYLHVLNLGQLPIAEEELLTYKQKMGESVFLGLRLMSGLDLNLFKNIYGIKLEQAYPGEIEKLSEQKLISLSDRYLYLTPKALELANYVAAFFV